MRGELDLLVTPLGRSVLAGDKAHAMDAAKVPVDISVPTLGLIARAIGKAEMPFRVLVPGVSFQERVFILGAWLSLAPVAVEDVLAGIDEAASVRDRALIDRIRSHCRKYENALRPGATEDKMLRSGGKE